MMPAPCRDGGSPGAGGGGGGGSGGGGGGGGGGGAGGPPGCIFCQGALSRFGMLSWSQPHIQAGLMPIKSKI